MTPLIVLLAASAVSVEAGWQPLPEGGHEYTVQIEPPLVRLLESGNDLQSDIPPDIHIRKLRITLGTGSLARVSGPQRDEPATNEYAGAPAAEGAPPVAAEDSPAAEGATSESTAGPAIPARFNEATATAQPLVEKASGTSDPQQHNADRPQLDGSVVPEAGRPWLPLAVVTVLLACSIGANLYLGWVARDARQRYRDAVGRFRVPASA